MWVNSEDAPKYKLEWRIRLERLTLAGSVERIEGQGVRLSGPASGKRAGIVSAVTSATGYFPPGLYTSGSFPNVSAGVTPRLIPITDPQLLDEVYEGIMHAINEEVLGENKWDEIMAYV